MVSENCLILKILFTIIDPKRVRGYKEVIRWLRYVTNVRIFFQRDVLSNKPASSKDSR